MTRTQFVNSIEEIYASGVEMIKAKNKDYAKDADPWANFRMAELIGVGLEKAILVRISDKLARISNLIDKEETVKDEKITDTVFKVVF